MNEEENGLLTPEERANVLNAINDIIIEQFGLEVCGYDDDGVFFNVLIWRR